MAYHCSICNCTLDTRYFDVRPPFSEGVPAPLITHARCQNSASDCVISRTWFVVNEIDRTLYDVNGGIVGNRARPGT
jgi:hypothetical protein